MNDYEFLASRLTEEALLCQMAEEAAELAQAALKLRRVIRQDSPTTVDPLTAVSNLLEEIADVQLSADVWKVKYFADKSHVADSVVDSVVDEKRSRWIRRLKEKEEQNAEENQQQTERREI
jgi:NTP pyrophosphatase (non-canonical NTP hydrolase)